jgi:hypothetical protein
MYKSIIMICMKRIFYVMLILFAMPDAVFGDVGYYSEAGKAGTLFPVKSSNVSMESEMVVIDVDRAGDRHITSSFHCLFHFKNSSKKAETALMGFPIRYFKEEYDDNTFVDMEEMEEMEDKDLNWVNNFTVTIDGKNIPYNVYSDTANPDLPQVGDYDAVYAFEYVFKPAEAVTINVDYDMTIQSTGSNPPPVSYYTVSYILKTIHTWNGPVKEADIILNVTFPYTIRVGLWDQRIGKIYPPFTRKEHFENFIPEMDFYFSFSGFVSTEHFVETLEKYLSIRKDNETITFCQDLKNNDWSKYSIDMLRNVFYWIGNDYFGHIRGNWESGLKKDYNTMSELVNYYRTAFLYCRSNTGLYENTYELERIDLSKWEHESTSPCYYIAYNIACAYAVCGQKQEGFDWLETAIRLKPSLKGTAKKDRDLDYLRNQDSERFDRIIR